MFGSCTKQECLSDEYSLTNPATKCEKCSNTIGYCLKCTVYYSDLAIFCTECLNTEYVLTNSNTS